MTLWGFPELFSSWNYSGSENKDIRLVVFSNVDEVELFVNGKSVGKKPVSFQPPMPNSVYFDTVFAPGKVEAVSYKAGKEISRDELVTTGAPAGIRLIPEKSRLKADGHDAAYLGIEILDSEGNVVPDAEIELSAKATGDGILAGFGSGNPKTEDNYTDGETVSFKGRAMAIIRSGYGKGTVTVEICAKEIVKAQETFEIV